MWGNGQTIGGQIISVFGNTIESFIQLYIHLIGLGWDAFKKHQTLLFVDELVVPEVEVGEFQSVMI